MKVAVHDTESAWLAARKKKLTSSNVPGLLGVYPSEQSKQYKNPYATWMVKTGKAEDPELEAMRLRFDLGHLVEERVAQEVEKREGVKLVDLGDYTTVSEGILMATPDRLIFRDPGLAALCGGYPIKAIRLASAVNNSDGPCEIKSDGVVYDSATWTEGQKFSYALVQAHVPAVVMGKDRGLIAALFGLGLGFEVYPFERNDRLVSLIKERSEEFWECVLTDTPPPAKFLDDSEAIGKSLAAIYGKDSGETVTLGDEAAKQLDHYEELGRQIKALEATRELIKNHVKREMGKATWAEIPGSDKRWQWAVEPRKGYTKVVEPSEPRVFRVVKG